MKASFQRLFRQIIPILSGCFMATALTGIILGFSNHLIQLPPIAIKIITVIHQGAFLGSKLTPVYVLLIGLGALIICLRIAIGGGHKLIFKQAQPSKVEIYRAIALIVTIPLAFCIETGVAYRLGMDWFGVSNKQTAVLLSFHGGALLQTRLGIVYTLGVGCSLIVLSILIGKTTKITSLNHKQVQKSLRLKFRKVYLAENGNQPRLRTIANPIKLGIIIGLVVLLGILYYLTSALFVAIAIIGVVILVSTTISVRKLFQSWQYHKEAINKLNEEEVQSTTMLKAIPDTILRVSEAGICLSYMPAVEAKYFVLYGNIINKHIREFLDTPIAEEFVKGIQLSLQHGSTHCFRFPISADSEAKYHEARITPIGETEVLILVREIANFAQTFDYQLDAENTIAVELLTESELIQVLQISLQNESSSQPHQVLICLGIEIPQISDEDTVVINRNLLEQIAGKIYGLAAKCSIYDLQNNDLVVLVSDRTMEQASLLVDSLYRDLNDLFADWGDFGGSIQFSIGLVEVNFDSSDVTSLVNATKATCQMAKQKVNFKTFR